MDVVEVSPPYDHAEITSVLANRVVLEALSGIARRRQRRRGRPTLGPAPAPARRPLTAAGPRTPRLQSRRFAEVDVSAYQNGRARLLSKVDYTVGSAG